MRHRPLLHGFVVLVALAPAFPGADPDPAVVVTEDATLADGIVAARLDKASRISVSLSCRGVEMSNRGGACRNIHGGSPGPGDTGQEGMPSASPVGQDPAKNGGAAGEVILRFPYTGQPEVGPRDIEIGGSLHRGDSGLFGWAVADHDPSDPPSDIEVSAACRELDTGEFDFLSTDGLMQRPRAGPEDRVIGTQLNPGGPVG